MRPLSVWGRIPEWGKAFLIAVALLLVVHVLVMRWVTVRSTSMYATLLPGDLVGVERWPLWTGLHRGDIVVFHDPLLDDRPMARRQLLVKRIAGMPGDEVELRDGQLIVNGKRVPRSPLETARWKVRLTSDTGSAGLLHDLGLPEDFVLPGHTLLDLPLNAELAKKLEQQPGVADVAPRGSTRAGAGNLFPFGPNFRWNNDNYGPLHVPARNDTVNLTLHNLTIYDRIISRYEHNRVSVADRELQINGDKADRYVIRQDYFFVLGDSRDHSSDSRYWGFVPADHVVGRGGFVLLNARTVAGDGPTGRWLLGLRR